MPTDSHTDPKGAVPPKAPPALKKARPEDEDEAAVAAPPPRREKTLPTGLSRAIVIATLIFSIAFATVGLLHDRYAIAPVPNSVNSFVYRLDRLTGALLLCGAQQCSVVEVDDAEER